MLFPELEETPSNHRMSRFLELSFEYRTSTPAELAEKLGYKRDTTVVQWMRGSAKVPLRHLSTIANFFSHDVAHVLSAWLAQECPDDHQIVSVADRVITIWEWQLVYLARDIHNYYDE